MVSFIWQHRWDSVKVFVEFDWWNAFIHSNWLKKAWRQTVTDDYNMISPLTNFWSISCSCFWLVIMQIRPKTWACSVIKCPLGVPGLCSRVHTTWINFSFHVNHIISSWLHVFQVALLLTPCRGCKYCWWSTFHRQQYGQEYFFCLRLDVINSLNSCCF